MTSFVILFLSAEKNLHDEHFAFLTASTPGVLWGLALGPMISFETLTEKLTFSKVTFSRQTRVNYLNFTGV